ncbi:hypothetical protein ASG17_00480 [Brevundimonas sp. Leaf363]|uniref:hypothetical protein n=1 Tax=Brevundimonas sp. Leaf363 TaxID=1736353 RepID=UPI0006F4B6B5|nr:hypothetical protein [Brevundimonas sp. Leaf363]KQS57251.1 hypothetical protein ASG17_00480 [Brevundimonas sp. Leaf363]
MIALTAVRGVIRKGAPEVTLKGDPTAAPSPVVFAVFRGGKRIAERVLTWPTDFAFDGEPGEGRARLPDTAALEPFAGIKPEASGKGLKRGPEWQLVRLFPSTRAEFEAAWYKRKGRLPDRETLQFSARQVTAHYPLDEADRAIAAVVQGYAAIDLADAGLMEEAAGALRRQIDRMEGVPATGLLRTDGVHQTASMYMALWQVLLSLGRFDEVVTALDDYIAHLRTHQSPFGRVVFNGCCSMLLRTDIHARRGEVEAARALASACGRYYVENMLNLEQKSQWFKETRRAHDASGMALEIVERLEAKKPALSPAVVLEAAHRLFDPRAAEALSRRYETFCAAQRAAA